MNSNDSDTTGVSESSMIDALLQSLRSGVTLRELKGVDDTTMEGVYAYAHQFYVNGQLDEAEKFFRFLYMFDFHNSDYVFGLASVYQLKKQYQKAIDLYAVAYALVRHDERPLFHAGQCHLALGRRGMARGCFEDVLSRCRDADMAERARTYLQFIAEGAPKDAFDSTERE
ncbi:SycD/LcrH family type III secretion system chaperone [Stenotrophomonas sp. B1-1]|uniref:SycD/LcrH family type III secretion system chaperone n=1 Tax=Stenotrophomonas sp. B1-1 TaxID=2710648 RepID=UPI0019674189|nr:SycD/LcrH family type III secretion system chaperone [Stenotrophomonas sp. B1-1]